MNDMAYGNGYIWSGYVDASEALLVFSYFSVVFSIIFCSSFFSVQDSGQPFNLYISEMTECPQGNLYSQLMELYGQRIKENQMTSEHLKGHKACNAGNVQNNHTYTVVI